MYDIFKVFLVYFTLIFPKMNQLLQYPLSLATGTDVKQPIHPTNLKMEMDWSNRIEHCLTLVVFLKEFFDNDDFEKETSADN